MSKFHFSVLVLIILITGFWLRIHQLDTYPPGVSNDEAVNVIDTFHIVRTGNFPMYEDEGRPEPLYRIVLAAGAFFWGATVWGTRFTSALIGMITIASVGWLTYESLGAWDMRWRRIGMATAMIALTVMIAHVTLSRSLYRAGTEFFLVTTSMAYILRGLRLRRTRDFALSGLCAGIAIYTYTAVWVLPFAFAALGVSLVLFKRGAWRMWLPRLALTAVIAALVMIPVLALLATHAPSVFGRAQVVAAQRLDLQQTIDGVLRQFYERGDENPQYNVASAPILSAFWLLPFVYGLATLMFRIRWRASVFILSGLVLFTLPAAASSEVSHGLRISGVFPMVAVICGIGVVSLVYFFEVRIAKTLPPTALSSVVSVLAVFTLLGSSLRSWSVYEGYWQHPEQWGAWSVYGYDLDQNEWFFRTDRRDFAAWIVQQDAPLLLPVAELEQPTTRVWLTQAFPNIVTPDEAYQLPQGTHLVLPYSLEIDDFMSETRDFAVLSDGTIFLLPPLSDMAYEQIIATRSAAEIVTRSGGQLTRMAQVSDLPDNLTLTFAPSTRYEAPIAQFGDGELQLNEWYGADTASGAETLTLTLLWSAERRIGHHYAAFVQLMNQDYISLANSEHYIHRWLYPSSVWRVGDLVPDTHTLHVPADLPPGAYPLMVGGYFGTHPRVETTGLLPDPLEGMSLIGWYKVPQTETVTISAAAQPISAVFGETFALDAARTFMGEDGRTYVELYWHSRQRRPLVDATIFVHVVDGSGEIVAQNDSRPWNGQYPTLVWDENEVVRTLHPVTLPADALAQLTLRVGMYTFPGPHNLPVTYNGGQDSAGLLPLGAISQYMDEDNANE